MMPESPNPVSVERSLEQRALDLRWEATGGIFGSIEGFRSALAALMPNLGIEALVKLSVAMPSLLERFNDEVRTVVGLEDKVKNKEKLEEKHEPLSAGTRFGENKILIHSELAAILKGNSYMEAMTPVQLYFLDALFVLTSNPAAHPALEKRILPLLKTRRNFVSKPGAFRSNLKRIRDALKQAGLEWMVGNINHQGYKFFPVKPE